MSAKQVTISSDLGQPVLLKLESIVMAFFGKGKGR